MNSFDFPVDFVYTWVNDQDKVWQEKKNRALGISVVEDAAKEGCRFTNSNELLYSIRSVYSYCPWFNKIYIVTDNQIPDWLDTSNPDIIIIDHKEIFGNEGTLPTFNSNVIESRLHHIPNLSEHYISLNDDFFFGRKLKKSFFFHNDGKAKLFLSLPKRREKIEYMITDEAIKTEPQYISTLHKTRRLVYERFGTLILNEPKHTPRPFNKSTIFDVEKEFMTEIKPTLHHQFRNREGLYFLALCAFYSAAKGLPVTTITNTLARWSSKHLSKLDYLKISPRSGSKTIWELRLLHILRPAFFCINDNAETTDQNRMDMVKTLKSFFPRKCNAEKNR